MPSSLRPSAPPPTPPAPTKADEARAELARRELQRRRHQADPAAWITDRLGEHLWSKQREVAASVAANRYTAVQSCHGTGKDWLAARLVAWWLDVHPVGEAFAVTTAPSSRQLEGILWREIGRAHRAGKLPGRLAGGDTPTWRIGDELVAWGRKPADLSDPEAAAAAFSGIHARHVLVVIDEASGIEPWLWDAVDSLMTNRHARTLAIGNPLDGMSRFAKVCAPGSGWEVIKISAFDSPAYTGEPVPPELLEVLVSREWVEERRRQHGEGSAYWLSRVLGEFPAASEDTLIQPAWIRAAQERRIELAHDGRQAYGVDVARSGNDKTIIYLDTGGRLRLAHQAAKADTMATAGEIARRLNAPTEMMPPGMTSAYIDTIGVGAGVYDRLREQDHPVVEFVASARAWEPQRFANRRAEAYWLLREEFENGLIDLDPADQELAAQLGQIRYRFNSKGQTLIESKDQMSARGVPSPDRADAAAMAAWGRRRCSQPFDFVMISEPHPLWDLPEQLRPHADDEFWQLW